MTALVFDDRSGADALVGGGTVAAGHYGVGAASFGILLGLELRHDHSAFFGGHLAGADLLIDDRLRRLDLLALGSTLGHGAGSEEQAGGHNPEFHHVLLRPGLNIGLSGAVCNGGHNA